MYEDLIRRLRRPCWGRSAGDTDNERREAANALEAQERMIRGLEDANNLMYSLLLDQLSTPHKEVNHESD